MGKLARDRRKGQKKTGKVMRETGKETGKVKTLVR